MNLPVLQLNSPLNAGAFFLNQQLNIALLAMMCPPQSCVRVCTIVLTYAAFGDINVFFILEIKAPF